MYAVHTRMPLAEPNTRMFLLTRMPAASWVWRATWRSQLHVCSMLATPSVRPLLACPLLCVPAPITTRSIMGVAGYLALPGGPDGNVMNGFPDSDPLMQVSVGVASRAECFGAGLPRANQRAGRIVSALFRSSPPPAPFP